MPSEMAILFLYAKITAEACSAALPTIGTRIVAMKSCANTHQLARNANANANANATQTQRKHNLRTDGGCAHGWTDWYGAWIRTHVTAAAMAIAKRPTAAAVRRRIPSIDMCVQARVRGPQR